MNDAGRIGFVIKGEYNEADTYDFLDIVYYRSASYVAKKLTVGNEPQENNEYWQIFAKNISSVEELTENINGIKNDIKNLKPVAASGNYDDLTNKPSIPAAVRVKGNAESSYRTGDVNLTAEDIGALPINDDGSINSDVDIKGLLSLSDILLKQDTTDSNGYQYLFNLDIAPKKGDSDNKFRSLHITEYDTNTEEAYNLYIGGDLIFFRDYDDKRTYLNAFGVIGCDDGIILSYTDTVNYLFYSSEFRSDKSDAISLGDSRYKWKEVYATNGTIQTSDRNEKNTIKELPAEKAEQLIYGLKPSTYKMNTGTSNRTHWGLISQDIEELFEEIGMTSLDFAGFIKSPKVREITEDENGNPLKKSIEEIVEGKYDYSLRYDEFIAPMIKTIQTQHSEIEILKQEMALLKQQMSVLLNKEA